MRIRIDVLAFALLALPCIAQPVTPLVDPFPLPSPEPSPQPFEFTIMAGGTVPLLSDSGGLVGSEAGAKTTVSPFVALTVDAPISSFANGPLLVVGGEFGALPGESLDIEKPESYRSLKMRIGVSQTLSKRLNFGLYAECGFATRISGDTTPRDRAPRWCGGGLRFKGDGSELTVTGNADQRLSSTADLPVTVKPGAVVTTQTLQYQATVEIRGHVPILRKAVGNQEAKMSVYVNAILGLDWSTRNPALTGGRHDVVTAGVAIGL